ncbi:MAG: PHP domain-containing protein [Defluviitaleaceae bacterium]|nr:PHP domain-containing protein [Defluviitaleaceae bacterium]
MESYIDLHIHTCKSDGIYTPSEIVKMASKKKLKAIAITDHDTVDGLNEASIEAQKLDIEFINGIEINTNFGDGQLHMLGYFINPSSQAIKSFLEDTKKSRYKVFIKWLLKLNRYGIRVSTDELNKHQFSMNQDGIIDYMILKKYVNSKEQALKEYFDVGGKLFIQRDKPTPEQAIKIIKQSGGIAVLAHPFRSIKHKPLNELVSELVSYGLNGIECYHSEQPKEIVLESSELVKQYNLVVTGGSDFHGNEKTNVQLGAGYGNLPIQMDILKNLKKHRNCEGIM